MELDFAAALEHSQSNRDEARAARRKYIDERRARIVQLLGPVRMVRICHLLLLLLCVCVCVCVCVCSCDRFGCVFDLSSVAGEWVF